MNRFKKYYENRRHFVCVVCNQGFGLSFWKWLWAPHFDMWRYRYVKCPRCGVQHWLKAVKVVD